MTKYICMIAYTNYSVDTRVRREAETLASRKEYEVSFLVTKQNDLPRKYTADGVNVIELNIRQYCGKSKFRYIISYLKFMLVSFVFCTRFLLLRNLDIVHVHNMPDFLVFAAIIPRLYGKKIILDIHDSMPETFAAKFGKKSDILFKFLCLEESLCCRFAHKVISVNHVQRDTLIKRGIPPRKIDVSMNLPDHKRFNKQANDKKKGKPLESFKLVYHGTLVKRLGIDLTIHAVATLIDRIPSLQFHIYGNGDDVEEFVELSKTLKLDQYVFFKNFVPIESLVGILEDMDLGVVSNRRSLATELMLPVKMLEYVALSIPVVAPRLRTIQHYFTEDMVSYFEPESIDSLAGAILEIHDDNSKRTKQVLMADRFIDKYGWENHQMDLINLYRGL